MDFSRCVGASVNAYTLDFAPLLEGGLRAFVVIQWARCHMATLAIFGVLLAGPFAAIGQDAGELFRRGVVYAAQGDYERAEEPFHRACELRPALPDACL